MGACVCVAKGSSGQRTTSEPSALGDYTPRYKADGVARAQFILNNPGKIKEVYDIEENKIGAGTFGSVFQAAHRATKVVRAIKTIPKRQMKNVEQFKEEISIMKMMDHPNIIKLFETFEDRRNIWLVMELCQGGELFEHIIDAGHFSESTAAVVVQQILRALFYMHENRIAHRDLKPENFLFLTKERIEKNVLKLIDFGLSKRMVLDQKLSTRAGTPYYVAPQVLSGKYDHMCDLWSAGVIMYVLLCGYPPFTGRSDQEILTKVKNGSFVFETKDWKHISDDAKSLVRGLLRMDPQDRFSAKQALGHDWIKLKAPKATKVSLNANFADNLKNFRSQSRLKKAALQIIAGQMGESKIRKLREIFLALDANGDGLLTREELREGMAKAGLERSRQELEQIMDGVDADGSGVIDYTEFLAATIDKRSYLAEDIVYSAFNVFDLDGDGRITLDELRQVLDNGNVEDVVRSRSVASVMREVDSNGDGTIDFKEFMTMMSTTKLTPEPSGEPLPYIASPIRRHMQSPTKSPSRSPSSNKHSPTKQPSRSPSSNMQSPTASPTRRQPRRSESPSKRYVAKSPHRGTA